MSLLKTIAVSLLITASMAAPTPIDAPVADMILERSPASTSAAGTTSSTLSCPSSNATTYTTNGVSFIIECGWDRPGSINMVYTANLATCIQACAAYSGCVDVSYNSQNAGACWMKSSALPPSTGNAGIWGARMLSGAAASSTTAVKTSTLSTSTIKTSTLSTSTLKTSSTPTTTATSASGGKRGIAYNTASYAAAFTSSPKVTWGYNWGQSSSGLSKSYDYVPMLWGASSGYTNSWSSNAKAAIAAGSTHLLGFNEPDLSSQSNLSPSAAAAAWKTYMQPFAGQAKLVSPAVTNGGGEMGLQWTKEFLGNCTGCTVDAIALHWYSNYAPDLQNHIQSANSMFPGKPIWVTEFGLTGSTDAQVESFLQTIMPWMDSQSYVERYAYFGAFTGYLLNSAGTGLSAYGSVYANY